MVVENQEMYALTNTNLNKFKRHWATCLLVPLTLKWVQKGANGPLGQSRYKEVY